MTNPLHRAGAGSVQGLLALVTEDDPYDREIEAVKRDGSFEFRERYLRRSIYGFKKKQLQLCRLVFPQH